MPGVTAEDPGVDVPLRADQERAESVPVTEEMKIALREQKAKDSECV